MTGEQWTLAAICFCSGLASGLLGMLCTIMRPMLKAMDGRDFRNFMAAFLGLRGQWVGKGVQLSVVARDVPRANRHARASLGRSRLVSFVLTAIGLGIVVVGVIIVSNLWKTPHYKVMLAWDHAPCRRTGRRDGSATSISIGSKW